LQGGADAVIVVDYRHPGLSLAFGHGLDGQSFRNTRKRVSIAFIRILVL
jgi:hypothetical protein